MKAIEQRNGQSILERSATHIPLMFASKVRLFLMTLMPLFTGCVAVSMHSTRPVEVRVTDKEGNRPVAGAKIEISYTYTGYGVFYVLRVPEPASAMTDEQGTANLPMADFFQKIIFKVNGERFSLNKELVRNGGLPEGGWWAGRSDGTTIHHAPPYIVELTPEKACRPVRARPLNK